LAVPSGARGKHQHFRLGRVHERADFGSTNRESNHSSKHPSELSQDGQPRTLLRSAACQTLVEIRSVTKMRLILDVVGSIVGLIRSHPLASFFGLAYSSWVLGVVLHAYMQATGTPVTMTRAGPIALMILGVADAFPSAAGIVMTLVVGGRKGVKELFGRLNPRRASVKWYAVAILTNPVVVTVVLVALAASISPDFLPAIFNDPTLAATLPFALFIGLRARKPHPRS
jgi:hypothetical protein